MAKELGKAYDKAIQDYKSCLDSDHFELVSRGASQVPEGFASDYWRKEADGSVFRAKAEALEAIAKERRPYDRSLTDAPTEEETRYIMSINGRSDMTRREANAALKRYTSHAAQRAIFAAAQRSGIETAGSRTDAESYLEELEQIEGTVERIFNDVDIAQGKSRQELTRNFLAGFAQESPASPAEAFARLFGSEASDGAGSQDGGQ